MFPIGFNQSTRVTLLVPPDQYCETVATHQQSMMGRYNRTFSNFWQIGNLTIDIQSNEIHVKEFQSSFDHRSFIWSVLETVASAQRRSMLTITSYDSLSPSFCIVNHDVILEL